MGDGMERRQVEDWLRRYVEAWRSRDRAAIGELFAADAAYRYHPYDPDEAVVRGREAIVRAWIEGEPAGVASTPDEPGTFEARYAAYAVDGDRAVAVGWTRYWTDATHERELDTYDNVFLLRFDAEGRCLAFTEFFVRRPHDAVPRPDAIPPDLTF